MTLKYKQTSRTNDYYLTKLMLDEGPVENQFSNFICVITYKINGGPVGFCGFLEGFAVWSKKGKVKVKTRDGKGQRIFIIYNSLFKRVMLNKIHNSLKRELC